MKRLSTMPNAGGPEVPPPAESYAYRSPYLANGGTVEFRPYQYPVFRDRSAGIVILHWSRQIGKSFALAAWAVDRLLSRPGRLVTVLSNSRENGSEFVVKCGEICERWGLQPWRAKWPIGGGAGESETRADRDQPHTGAGRSVEASGEAAQPFRTDGRPGGHFRVIDRSTGMEYKNMRFEVHIRVHGHTGRIKVLAANPRTARGFSGDLILDEFAFHEDSQAIWEAAEPILSSNADFLCRIASTGNGRHNMFYRLVSGVELAGAAARAGATSSHPGGALEAAAPTGSPSARRAHRRKPASLASATGVRTTDPYERSAAGYRVSRVSRTRAWELGTPVFDPNTRASITPGEARSLALDKRAYDQNYELAFNDETTTLLTYELISAAENADVGVICSQAWSAEALALMTRASGPLLVGFDVGRQRDLSVISVVESAAGLYLVRGILRLEGMRLPEQQKRLGEVCRLPKFHRAAIDMTGIGLGLFEYAEDAFGSGCIQGVNFATSVAVTPAIRSAGEASERVRVTEALAMELLRAYEEGRIRHPADAQLREDLRKPEKLMTPGGRVSIAATRSGAGHADHFWSLALAIEAGASAATFFIPVAFGRGSRERSRSSRRERAWAG